MSDVRIIQTMTVMTSDAPPHQRSPEAHAAIDKLAQFRRVHGYDGLWGSSWNRLLYGPVSPEEAASRERHAFGQDFPYSPRNPTGGQP